MTESRWHRIERFSGWIVGSLALGFILLVSYVLVERARYPLDLEWMEAGTMLQAQRTALGQIVYGPPTPDFIVHLYTPLYPLIAALIGKVFGFSFPAARILGLISTIAVGLGIYRSIRRHDRPRADAILAIAFFASCYPFCYRWFEVARPDMLALAFVVWGAAMQREAWGDRRKAILAGLLLVCGFWSKQSLLPLIGGICLGAILVAPRMWRWTWGVVALGIFGIGAFAVWRTEGWFWYYNVELHGLRAYNWERLFDKSWKMFAHAWPIVVGLWLLAIASWLSPWWSKTRRIDSGRAIALAQRYEANRGLIYWHFVLFVALLESAATYATAGAEPNNFTPAAAFLAISTSFLFASHTRGGLALRGAILVQVGFLAFFEPRYEVLKQKSNGALAASYRPLNWLSLRPEAVEVEQAQALRAMLIEFGSDAGWRGQFGTMHRGEVLALQRPWWSVLSGGEGNAESMGIAGLSGPSRTQLESALSDRIEKGRYAGIWTEGPPPAWMRRALSHGYRLETRFDGDKRVLPLTGYLSVSGMYKPPTHSQYLFVRIAPPRVPRGRVVLVDFEDSTWQGVVANAVCYGSGPVASIYGDDQLVGPIGGKYLLSSGAGRMQLRAKGCSARSASFRLPLQGALVGLMIGYEGQDANLSASWVNEHTNERIAIALSGRAGILHEEVIVMPATWADADVHLELADDSSTGALLVDEIWIERQGL